MNKQIWEMYKFSNRGKEAIELFSYKDGENEVEWAMQIFKKYNEYFGGEDVIDYCKTNFCDIVLNIIADKLDPKESESNFDYFNRLIDNIEISEVKEDEIGNLYKEDVDSRYIYVTQKDYKSLCAILSEISLALYYLYIDTFFPILFREQFDVFMKILDILEIPMPELPAKSDKRGRLLLYIELNEAILKFANENQLTIGETCACIYDFAFMLLKEANEQVEIPEPTNIWLTGGSKEDYKTFLEKPVNGLKSVWTCNENTKRGDIIIMYVLSPYSCVQSIWRADIDGVYTPFNYYNSRTRATNGIVIPHISLNELKADSYFSQLPITRKNFQGVNGVQFSARDYNELQRLLKAKGFDVSVLPQLYKPDLEYEGNLKNEKDVEDKLVMPLLVELGYSQGDWQRQLSQKAGRNLKAIPDFVFLSKGEKHFENAPFVLEAKFFMNSSNERMNSFNQALSYCKMMSAELLGLCDKDRIIIYRRKNGIFDRFNPVFEKHWGNLKDPETFSELKKIIGKEVVAKLKH